MLNKRLLTSIGLVVLWTLTNQTFAQKPKYLIKDSFETGESAPLNWRKVGKVVGVEFVYDRKTASHGKRSLGLQRRRRAIVEQPVPETIQIDTPNGGTTSYVLLPPANAEQKPKAGYPFLFVLPGGDGSAESKGFVRAIHQLALGGDFIVAQPIAPPRSNGKGRRTTTGPGWRKGCLG